MKKPIFPATLLAGIAFDILFWKKVPGISFPFFVAITLTLGFLMLKNEKVRLAKASMILLAGVAFFSVMTMVHKEPLTSFLNIVATLGLMMLLAMTYRGGKWISFGLREYLNRFFSFLGVVLVNPVLFNNHPDQHISNEDQRTWWAVLKPVLRGILLALPVLLVFTALFASADLVFAEKVKALYGFNTYETLGANTEGSWFEYTLSGFDCPVSDAVSPRCKSSPIPAAPDS